VQETFIASGKNNYKNDEGDGKTMKILA